ncbi:DUF4365 domain-containing protein [Aliivibrio sp. EL58]|uniref:DUF4365 domain-containing protein n=1 Tax=Aliivibrio sp. EL58 TaxID=2107582 RepID=UPI000EFC6570|nr:DUF4365 domain-containing protein [Aliivibrio sp. EL58]
MSSQRGPGGTAVSHSKELVSLSHVYALAAASGTNVSTTIIDNVGIDITFYGKDYVDCVRKRPKLDVQLKCFQFSRHDLGFKNDTITYQLEKKNYDPLTDSVYHSILVVNPVPDNQEDWIHSNTLSTEVRFGCYWYSLMNEPELTTGSKQIKVPTNQRLTPEALIWMMKRVANNLPIENCGGNYA